MINIEDGIKKSHKAIKYLNFKKADKKIGNYIIDFL